MGKFTVLPTPRFCCRYARKGRAADRTREDPVSLSQRLQNGTVREEFGISIQKLSVDEFCAAFGQELSEGFCREEGYLLRVENGVVSLGGDTDAALFYAISTLSQIMATAEGDVPALSIEDWPSQATRGFNICYHVISDKLDSLAPNFEFLLRLVRTYANFKMNAMVIEFEGMFPYQKHPLLCDGEGFTMEQIKLLAQVCEECHVEVIPLVQSLGHAYYVLRHPEYAHLRETARTTQQYCPSNPACRAFYFELAQEILDVFPNVRRWHMGGDESRRLGVCDACARKVREQGMSHLYADHMNQVASWMLERGITPLSWGDIFEEHPETLGVLDKRIIICYWNYDIIEWYRSFLMQKIKNAGYRVLGCAASKFGVCSDAFYLYKKSMRNVSVMANETERIGAEGTMLTDWTKHCTYEVGMPSTAYSAQISWAGTMPEKAFITAFSRVMYGTDMPQLDDVFCLLSEFSFGNMDSKDDIWVTPYCNIQNMQSVDGLDRFDHSHSEGAVQDVLRENVRQEISPRTVETLRSVLQRTEEAGRLLDEYERDIAWNADIFGTARVAADTLACKSTVGLALDEAVKLLKYPLPDEQNKRDAAAQKLEEALALWTQVRQETMEMRAYSNFPASLANKLASCFPQALERYMREYAACLRRGEQLQGLLDLKKY